MSIDVITLGDLTPRDQGRRVSIHGNHATVTGTLRSFNVESDWVDVTPLGTAPDDRPEQIQGQRTMRIAIGEWETSNLPLNTPVEVER